MTFGISSVAEFNTVITLLGFVAASVQAATGLYAAYYKKKTSILKTNEVLNRVPNVRCALFNTSLVFKKRQF